MSLPLAEKYCLLHRQGFVPIYVADDFDVVQLTEAAVEAGAKAIEITCRRPDVMAEVKELRRRFPGLVLLVGSVVDDGKMLDFLQRRRPDMPSLDALADAGADGFASMMPLSESTLQRLSPTHLMLPGVETVPEAVRAIEAGAHFAKFFNTSALGGAARLSLLSCGAMHGLLPLFVTGGVTLDRIAPYAKAGAALLGSGWDVLLGDRYATLQADPHHHSLVTALRCALDALADARNPASDANASTTAAYLDSLPHYHALTT